MCVTGHFHDLCSVQHVSHRDVWSDILPVRGICACFHIINNTVSLRRSISSFERLHPDCTVPRIVPLCHANQGVCQACTHQGGVQEPIRVHIVWRGVGGWGGCTNQHDEYNNPSDNCSQIELQKLNQKSIASQSYNTRIKEATK